LDDWLKRRALNNQASGASRTYVICDAQKVIGYYAVASGAVSSDHASGRFRRNMPEPIPVALLGRLAIDQTWQGKGLGRVLFKDCALRINAAADILGIRGIVVHALSAEAKAFYIALGFEASPLDPMTLMVKLSDIEALL
jgi:GNAT superfamily N-acetyltransferase